MAAHPDTGIDYEVDRFVKIYVEDLAVFDIDNPATYDVVEWNALWPRLDGAPVEGANPHYLYFLRTEEDRPEVDHRYTLATTQSLSLTDPTPPEGYAAGVYHKSYAPVKLSPEQLKQQVETAFQAELRERFPETDDPSALIAAGGALARKADGAVLTPDQEESVARMVAIEDVVRQLRAKQAEFDAAIDADQDYDLTDWTIEE